MTREVWAFFYGSFMNPEVMRKAGLENPKIEVATIPGFDISIAPHANLIRSSGAVAYGLLVRLTHAQLAQLYGSQTRGEVYEPEAVLVTDQCGKFRAAMCYIVTDMAAGAAESEYVEMIAGPAERHGFPDWYIKKLRSFAPLT